MWPMRPGARYLEQNSAAIREKEIAGAACCVSPAASNPSCISFASASNANPIYSVASASASSTVAQEIRARDSHDGLIQIPRGHFREIVWAWQAYQIV